jgi:hypothetical protein
MAGYLAERRACRGAAGGRARAVRGAEDDLASVARVVTCPCRDYAEPYPFTWFKSLFVRRWTRVAHRVLVAAWPAVLAVEEALFDWLDLDEQDLRRITRGRGLRTIGRAAEKSVGKGR